MELVGLRDRVWLVESEMLNRTSDLGGIDKLLCIPEVEQALVLHLSFIVSLAQVLDVGNETLVGCDDLMTMSARLIHMPVTSLHLCITWDSWLALSSTHLVKTLCESLEFWSQFLAAGKFEEVTEVLLRWKSNS